MGLFARMPIANRAYGIRYHKFIAVATRPAIPPASAIPIGIAKLLIISERKHCKALTVMPPRNPQMLHSSRLTGIVPGNLHRKPQARYRPVVHIIVIRVITEQVAILSNTSLGAEVFTISMFQLVPVCSKRQR